MLAKVINYGPPMKIPTPIGFFFLNRLNPVTVKNKEIIEIFQDYNKRDDIHLVIEILEAAKKKKKKKLAIDYSKFPINELRSMASEQGAKKVLFMKKSELIESLGGKNGSDTIS